MMIYPPHDRLLLARNVGEIRRVCPAITPVLGAELLINGNMETGDPPSGWPAVGGATLSGQADERTGGSGAQSLQILNGAVADQGYTIQNPTVVVGTWYRYCGWARKVLSNPTVRIRDTAGYDAWLPLTTVATTTSWTEFVLTGRAAVNTTANVELLSGSAVQNDTARFDDVSLKPLTFTSLTTYLGRRSRRPGTYICRPSLTTGTQCGLWICYRDANNFVLMSHDGTTAKVEKRIAGTYTTVISGAAAYVAGAQLKVVIAANGTDYSLFYNGSAVGATQAVTDAGLGTMVRGLSTYASNTVGLVTTSTATA